MIFNILNPFHISKNVSDIFTIFFILFIALINFINYYFNQILKTKNIRKLKLYSKPAFIFSSLFPFVFFPNRIWLTFPYRYIGPITTSIYSIIIICQQQQF